MKVKTSKFVQIAKRLMQARPATTIGIDIGSGAIKVAEIHWDHGNPELKTVGIAELPVNIVRDGYIVNKTVLAETMQRLLAVCGVVGRHVVLSVSGQSVLVRELRFPAMSTVELRQAIKWELDKYIPPAEVDNYYFDFAVVSPACQEEEMKVLLVAAPLERIITLTDLTKELGFKPVAIEIEPLALYRTMDKADNSIVVDLGAYLCQLHIFQQGVPLVSRFIPLGGVRYTEVIMQTMNLDFHEAERMKLRQKLLLDCPDMSGENSSVTNCLKLLVAELSREICRMMDYYKMQNRSAIIDRIILTGGSAQLLNLAGKLAEQLEDTHVVVHTPLTEIQLAPSLDTEWLTSKAPQLAVAIGLALRGGESD